MTAPASILILHCHDLGRFLGSYGVATVSTPALDALAGEAVVFEQAFATSPHCSPARASLFTGTYPQRNGVLGLTHEPFAWDLADPSSHLASRLGRAGYRTELVGVQHESRVLPDPEVAERLGFDRVRTGGDRDLVVERAVEALDAAAADARPFYLQVGFTEPHRVPSERDRPGVMGFLGSAVEADDSRGVTVPPFLVDDDGAREEMAELQGAVAHMDEGVGRVLAHLDRLGLAERTIVLFTTDHGLALPRAKCTLYDAGLEVAMLLRAPGRSGWAGRRITAQVSHVDVVPTLFELAGLEPPAGLAGASLVPLVEEGRPARRHTFGQLTFHTYYDPKRSVRSPSHKLIANFSNAPRSMDPTQSWVHRSLPADLAGPSVGTSPALELYDLVDDPEERRNLAGTDAEPAELPALAATLLDWMRRNDDPLLAPEPGHRRHELALAGLVDAAGRDTAGRDTAAAAASPDPLPTRNPPQNPSATSPGGVERRNVRT